MREYFCAYHSMLDATRKLSDAEVGRLFRGLLQYSMTKEQPQNLQGREEVVFDIYSQQIDREIEKYEQTCKRNQMNVTSRYQSLPVVTSRNESYQNKDKDKDKDEEKDKDKTSSPRRRGGGDVPAEFTRFWAVYPRKVSKQTALKAWRALKPDAGLVDAIVADVTRRLETEWRGKDMQYIPHPSTYLNQRRWEDETGVAAVAGRTEPDTVVLTDEESRLIDEIYANGGGWG